MAGNSRIGARVTPVSTTAGLAGGFNSESQPAVADGARTRGVLVVLYAASLIETYRKVKEAGGKIVREIFEFPGGKRFHFADPNGNELAVWSE